MPNLPISRLPLELILQPHNPLQVLLLFKQYTVPLQVRLFDLLLALLREIEYLFLFLLVQLDLVLSIFKQRN